MRACMHGFGIKLSVWVFGSQIDLWLIIFCVLSDIIAALETSGATGPREVFASLIARENNPGKPAPRARTGPKSRFWR